MIGARQGQTHQPQHRAQKALGLAQRQVEEQTQRQRGLDGDIGVNGLSPALAGHRRSPGVDGVLADPQRDVAASAQRLLVLAPVFDAKSGFIFGMSVSFLRLDHACHHELSGLILPDDDERYHGCQALERDSCINADTGRPLSYPVS